MINHLYLIFIQRILFSTTLFYCFYLICGNSCKLIYNLKKKKAFSLTCEGFLNYINLININNLESYLNNSFHNYYPKKYLHLLQKQLHTRNFHFLLLLKSFHFPSVSRCSCHMVVLNV